MSEITSLQLKERTERGKGPCARLRSNGLVPGVFYDAKGENISFTVENLALGKAFSTVRYSKFLELDIEIAGRVEKRNALFKKLVSHPVKRRYDHVDFVGIELDKDVEVNIPLVVTGKAKGVVLGGELEIFRDEILVRCLPTNIPDSVTVDVTEMNIGDRVFVDQLALPEAVRAVYEDNFVVLAVHTPSVEEPLETAAPAEAAPAEAPAAEAAPSSTKA